MKLTINDSKKIKDIQNEFNGMFPFLKVEFFSKPHEAGGGSEKKYMSDANKTIHECRTIHHNGPLEVVPTMTVTDLEKDFQNVYGLSVQVFRKSGKVWLETTNTDYWTLAKHNEVGELSVKGNIETEN